LDADSGLAFATSSPTRAWESRKLDGPANLFIFQEKEAFVLRISLDFEVLNLKKISRKISLNHWRNSETEGSVCL
jgi:hypothetical protein